MTDLGAHLNHHPGELMTGHMREHDLFIMSGPRMPITAAHTGRHHSDHHPAGRDGGLGHLPNLRLGLNGIDDDGAHRYILATRRSLHLERAAHSTVAAWTAPSPTSITTAPNRDSRGRFSTNRYWPLTVDVSGPTLTDQPEPGWTYRSEAGYLVGLVGRFQLSDLVIGQLQLNRRDGVVEVVGLGGADDR